MNTALMIGQEREQDQAAGPERRGGAGAGAGAQAPRLLEYPALESMGVYDADDLHPAGVFIFVTEQTGGGSDSDGGSSDGGGGGGGGGSGGALLYVWVGCEAGEELGGEVAAAGARIGEDAAVKLGLRGARQVRVEREGDESAEFWEAFEAGLHYLFSTIVFASRRSQGEHLSIN